MRVCLSVLFIAALIAVSAAPRAQACAIVYRPRQAVRVEGEEVLIVWDQAARREHLIRHIGFRGEAADFGFLVPTPSEPEVAVVEGFPFDPVFRAAQRVVRRRSRHATMSARGSSMSARGVEPEVTVVATHHLAGQTATVLAASDAGALDRWLAEHGYPHGDALRSYVRPYLRRGFLITAFRYDAGTETVVDSPIIRLSFQTDTPFFPYAEPTGDRPGRPFRVNVLAAAPVDARLARTPGRGGQRWRARVGYRGRMPPAQIRAVLSASGLDAISDLTSLTVFDEPVSRRGRLDLWFRTRPGLSRIAPRLTTRIAPPPVRLVPRAFARHVPGESTSRVVDADTRRRIRSVQNSARQCLQREMRATSARAADFTLRLQVPPSGGGASVEVTARRGADAVIACVVRQVARVHWSPAVAGTLVIEVRARAARERRGPSSGPAGLDF